MVRNYARDFNDKVLNEKYEEELYHNKNIRNKIKQLKDNMIFYFIAFAWLVGIIFLTKLTVVGMTLFMFLNYKMDCLNRKYIYHVGFMFIVAAVYALGKFLVSYAVYIPFLAAPFIVVGPILIVFILLAYFFALVISILKYWIFTRRYMKRISLILGRYNLGVLLFESDEKLCRLESEIIARRQRAEKAELCRHNEKEE